MGKSWLSLFIFELYCPRSQLLTISVGRSSVYSSVSGEVYFFFRLPRRSVKFILYRQACQCSISFSEFVRSWTKFVFSIFYRSTPKPVPRHIGYWTCCRYCWWPQFNWDNLHCGNCPVQYSRGGLIDQGSIAKLQVLRSESLFLTPVGGMVAFTSFKKKEKKRNNAQFLN